MKSTFEVGSAMSGKGAKSHSRATLRTRSGVRMRSGVSLLISVVLISIVMVFAIGINNLVTSSLRQTANVNRSNQAFFAAEGALESGLLANQTKGAGYTAPTATVPLGCTGPTCPEANVTIQGTVKTAVKYMSGSPYGGMYGMPTPGTGTVGSNCNPLTAYYDKKFNFPEGATQDIAPWEHPCNWNKIKVGESAAIPLYTVTDDVSGPNCPMDSYLGYRVCNPVNLGLTSLVLRVRTPCINGDEFCLASERYDLYFNPADPSSGDQYYGGNDVIVAWQITGTSLDHKTTYTLKPNTSAQLSGVHSRILPNSEIYESLLKSARMSTTEPFKVLKGMNAGVDLTSPSPKMDSITNFLNNLDVFNRTGLDIINQPVLKLSLVHSLDAFYPTSTSVPYLEYQLLTNSNTLPPADTSQTITAEGVSGTFKQVLEVKQPQETGLLEYVIQQ